MNEALPSLTVPKGIVTVELFDARTKKLLYCERKENFIALPAKERFAWVQMNEVANGMPSNIPNYYAPPNAFTTLYLSGDTSPESPSTERYMRNPIVGWANRKTPYSGSDPLRGTINVSESTWDRTKAHYVFDFPTNAANGTIASIGFAGFYIEPTYQSCGVRKISTAPIISQVNLSRNSGLAMANGLLHLLDYNKVIRQIDPNTGKDMGSISISGISASIYSFTFGGGYFWAGDYNTGKIFKINPDGTLAQTINVPLPQITALAYDNGDLWIYVYSSLTDPSTGRTYPKSLYKISTSGEITTVIPNPINDFICNDLAVDQSFIYYFEGDVDPRIAIIDKTTGNLIALLRCDIRSFGGQSNSYGIEIASDGSFFTIHYISADSVQPGGNYLLKIMPGALGTRVLLGSTITKNNSQTLKVTYDLLYNLNAA